MRDPHVERLHFEIGSGEGTSYENPEPLTFENPPGRFDALDGKLLVENSCQITCDRFVVYWKREIATIARSNP